MLDERLSALIFSQITHLPFLLVLVVGIVVALLRWATHPKVSLLSLSAFALLLLGQLLRMGYTFWLVGGREPGLPLSDVRAVMTWINFGVSLLDLMGWVLLLIALFGWRKSEEDVPEAPQGPV